MKPKLDEKRPDQPEFAVMAQNEKAVRHLCGTACYAVHHGTGYSYFIFSGWDEMANVLRMVKDRGIVVYAEAVRRHEALGQKFECTAIRTAAHGR